MMNTLKFLVFALYDLNYKNADRHADAVRVVFVLVLYQFCFLIMLFGVFDALTNVSVITSIKKIGTMFCLIPLFYLNYRFLITKGGFEKLCVRYHNADINTKRNRIVAAMALIVIFITMVAVISSTKYLFSSWSAYLIGASL